MHSKPGDISQAEALAILEQSEEVGLVHTVSNVMEGVGYVCNCCGCCCGILRGITEYRHRELGGLCQLLRRHRL